MFLRFSGCESSKIFIVFSFEQRFQKRRVREVFFRRDRGGDPLAVIKLLSPGLQVLAKSHPGPFPSNVFNHIGDDAEAGQGRDDRQEDFQL